MHDEAGSKMGITGGPWNKEGGVGLLDPGSPGHSKLDGHNQMPGHATKGNKQGNRTIVVIMATIFGAFLLVINLVAIPLFIINRRRRKCRHKSKTSSEFIVGCAYCCVSQ